MSVQRVVSISELHLVGVDRLRKRWGWFLGLGVVLALLGTIALGSAVLTTLASMVFVGWLMMMGGVFQTLHAFTCREWGGFFIDLLAGLLYAVAGLLIVLHPAATATGLTLLIAILLIFGGIFRIAVALTVRFHNWLWLLLHGAVNLLLGIFILQDWPMSGLQVIGLFIGIDMIFNGWSLIMLGLAARSLPVDNQPV